MPLRFDPSIMKVLFLPQTAEHGPSSRYRVYQFLPLLHQRGVECEISPGIDSALYDAIYLHRTASKSAALQAIWQRRRTDLHRINDFDAVFIQKGFFPGLYSGLELKMARRRPVIFDFDDAIWLPRQGGNPLLRQLHREREVQKIMQASAAVLAGNEFLAEYASQFNRNVAIVPSSLDLTRYKQSPAATTVGWIGSSSTMPYLQPLRPVFETLRITPRVIASGNPATLEFPVDFRQWRLETELDELAQIGIGLAPLPDNAWERGKCGVKLLQYMACSIPVIASPVGVHNRIVQDGTNGFLARDTGEWIARLQELLANPELRRQLGAAGRKSVEETYSLTGAADKVASVLRSCR
jgi:glycosyltransferase involved in cell wall biosynthesis